MNEDMSRPTPSSPSDDVIVEMLRDVLAKMEILKQDCQALSDQMDRGPNSHDRRIERLETGLSAMRRDVGKLDKKLSEVNVKLQKDVEANSLDKRTLPFSLGVWAVGLFVAAIISATGGALVVMWFK